MEDNDPRMGRAFLERNALFWKGPYDSTYRTTVAKLKKQLEEYEDEDVLVTEGLMFSHLSRFTK